MTLAAELAYLLAAPCPPGTRFPGAAALLAHLQPRNVDPIPARPGPGLEKTFVELANPPARCEGFTGFVPVHRAMLLSS